MTRDESYEFVIAELMKQRAAIDELIDILAKTRDGFTLIDISRAPALRQAVHTPLPSDKE